MIYYMIKTLVIYCVIYNLKKMEISGLEPEAFSLLTKCDTSYTISPIKFLSQYSNDN